MKRMLLAAVMIVASIVFSEAADLKTYAEQYRKTLENIVLEHGGKVTTLGEDYTAALDKLLARVKKQGDLDKTTAVMNEAARFKEARAMPETLSELPEMKSIQSFYVKNSTVIDADKAKQIVSLTRKYDVALEELQKTLVASDRLDEAKAVQEERRRARADRSYVDAADSLLACDADDHSADPHVTEKPATTCTLRFRGIDQNNYGIRERYRLQLNDEEVVEFDEKNQAKSNGDDPEDWELYEIVLPNNKLKARNTLTMELAGSYAVANAGGQLLFDFIELLKDKQVVWSVGKEDFSAAEFSRAFNPVRNKLTIDEKTNTGRYKVSRTVEQDAASFPAGIYDRSYETQCHRLVIEF